MLAIHILSFLSIGLDIPFLRQCVGFVYLTFVPGFIIGRALKISEKSITETILLSVSISISYVMFSGLLINTLCPIFGFSEPLFVFPSGIILLSSTLIIFLYTQRQNIRKNFAPSQSMSYGELHIGGLIICILSILVFLFGVIGALYTYTPLIVFAILGTALLFVICTLSKKLFPSKYYVFVLFLISLGLLYQSSLLSQYIMGWDIFNEYYVFKMTLTEGYWSPPGVLDSFTTVANYNSVLSVTILPTIYSTFLNLSGDFIFKVIYPFILALVPIFLYKTYQNQSGKLISLLAVMFFIANPLNFYGMESLSLGREVIGYLFISAAVFCLFKRKMDPMVKKILIVIFSAGVAVSAYSLAFIYVFIIVFVFIAMNLSGKKDGFLTPSFVLTLVAIVVGWYLFVSTPPLNKLSYVMDNVYQRFISDLFSSQARFDPQYAQLSLTTETNLIGLVHKILIYVTHGFIVIGAAIITLKPKISRYNSELRYMVVSATFLLILSITIPNVAPSINFSRFYRLTMLFLSPLFVMGGLYVFDFFKWVLPRRVSKPKVKHFNLILLAILVASFFLFRSGFANYASGGYQTSYPLNYDNIDGLDDLSQKVTIFGVSVTEYDLYSARWLTSKIEMNSSIYGDERGVAILYDYTNFSRDNTYLLFNTTTPETGSYLYFRGFNIMENVVLFNLLSSYPRYDLSDISPLLEQTDKIYSNGESEVYFVP